MMRASRSGLLDDDGKDRVPKALLPVYVQRLPPFGCMVVGRKMLVGSQQAVLEGRFPGRSFLEVQALQNPQPTTHNPRCRSTKHQPTPESELCSPLITACCAWHSLAGITVSNASTYSHPHAADFLGP